MPSDLTENQLFREQRMADEGAQRYDAGLETATARGEDAGSSPLRRISRAALPEVSNHLRSVTKKGSSGKGQRVLNVLKTLGEEKAAAIGLIVVTTKTVSRDVRSISNSIGVYIEAELSASELRTKDRKALERIFEKVEGPKRRKRVLKTQLAKETEYQPWERAFVVRVGSYVLNAVLVASGLVYLSPENEVRFTSEAQEWLAVTKERERWSRPMHRPMVVCPLPWKGNEATDGPYLSEAINRTTPLVRTYDNETRRLVTDHAKRGSMKEALDAVNALQATPYRINSPVLEMVKWAWKLDLGGEIKKLPRASLVDVPAYPDDFDDLDVREQRRLKAQVREMHELNRAIESNAVSFLNTIAEAEDLAQYERFFLPHNCDFRGRVYPIPHFNHQREDYVSALFEFADGVPLGSQGHYWLAIHLVGCGEFDNAHKRPLDDRYMWVLHNEQVILDCARDPQEHTFWMLADKPFKFLAACFEWAGYRRDGADFNSRIPVSLDGSNSGLQHYSAALRSSNDAFHVNLRDVEEPQDVYAAVASKVRSRLEDHVSGGKLDDIYKDGGHLNRRWLDHGVTRKTVKRQVMTYAYSSARFGFKEQIMSDLMKPLQDKVYQGQLEQHPFGTFVEQAQASNFLAGVIWDSIHEVISGAAEGMNWFKQVARLLASENKPMTWVTPVGFPVLHKYSNWEVQRIDLHVFDQSIPVINAGKDDRIEEDGVFRRIRQNLRIKPDGRLDKKKQKSAVAPNAIHSMDAAHLMRIITRGLDEGITDFCMIHDSFATHAGKTDRFFWLIREAFVEMYEDFDIFQVIYDTAWAQLSTEGRKQLPLPPTKGDLDLSEVLRSKYSFC